MTWLLRTWIARVALFAVAGMALGTAAVPAQAADLGGNCCADLEERIAELEATTARKGNRKVSLTVYGQVNEAVLFWDDGVEANQTFATNDNSRTRFGFKGEAKINDDWKAGYVLEIGVRANNSKRFNQNLNTADADDRGLDVRHSRWFIGSKSLGTISVGTTPTAMEGVTEINLAQTKDAAKYSDIEDSGLGLLLRGTNGALSAVQWRRLIRHGGDQPGEGKRREGVWYQSPEYMGFNFDAGWGADDTWDLGLRYKGDMSGFKIAAGGAYGENTDENADGPFFECISTSPANSVPGGSSASCQQYGGSMSIMHEKTGLYFNLAGGVLEDDNVLRDTDLLGTNADNQSKFWAIEAGIEQKFFDLGRTTIFGQYYDLEGGANARLTVAAGDAINSGIGDANVFSSGLQMVGGGVVQEISSASMSLYVYYRHLEGDVTLANNGIVAKAAGFEDLDIVVSGAIIKF
jgi:predicted porin